MKVAFLTAGGLAPCLSATIARLTKNYFENYNNIQIGHLYGYKGLLLVNLCIPKSIIHNIDNTTNLDLLWETAESNLLI